MLRGSSSETGLACAQARYTLNSQPRKSISKVSACLPFPSPGDLPDPGIEPESPSLRADSLPSEPPGNPLRTRVGMKQCCLLVDIT